MKRHLHIAGLMTLGALLAPLAQATTVSAPETVKISWQGVDQAALRLSTMDLSISSEVPVTRGYATSALNYTYVDSGVSFLAFCIEPNEGNGRAGRTYTYNVESFSGAQAQHLQGLFSTSYASLASYQDKAAFQLAVWELVRETSSQFNVSQGSFYLLDNNPAVVNQANSMLSQALSYTGPSLYALTKLTNYATANNAGLQDLVTATRLNVNNVVSAVPEPSSYALLAAGLGVVGLLARRRLPR